MPIFLFAFSAILFSFFNTVTAWFAFVPLFFAIHYTNIKKVWLYGGLYGAFSYLLFLTWLFSFSVQASFAVMFFYFLYWAILCLLLKLCDIYLGRFAFFAEAILICVYEYLKTLGFLGFSYGINGYSQWNNLYLIQIADIFGVWGISFLVNFFSAVVGSFILCYVKKQKVSVVEYSFFILECACVLFAFCYGTVKINLQKDKENSAQKIQVIAVQPNTDPWKTGFKNYSDDVKKLIQLTEKALEENPNAKIVVWPETAVVPSILKGVYSPQDENRKNLIKNLLSYIDSKNCTFVIGNSHTEENNSWNSVFVFEPKKNVIPPNAPHYEKMHLIPFSEYFPYKKTFPKLYKALLQGDTHLWTPGTERKVFYSNGLSFSCPICFEDTFGRDCKLFCKNGAKSFINLSNDAWSKSKRAQKQHLQMAVFRSVENHVPSVRSTASGETCVINSYGKIISKIEPFISSYVVSEVPCF